LLDLTEKPSEAFKRLNYYGHIELEQID